MCTILHNFVHIYTSCVIFLTQQLVGSYVSQYCVIFLNSGHILYVCYLHVTPRGHSHMSVDIKYPSIDPLFYADPTPNDPLFYSVHTQWPPFFHFCIKFYIKIANFCALLAHFEKFNDFVAILKANSQILPWNCIFAHWMTPIFGSPHPKSPHFFGAHTEWPPFFWRNLTPNAPYFRSPVCICTSLSYLSAPRDMTHSSGLNKGDVGSRK